MKRILISVIPFLLCFCAKHEGTESVDICLTTENTKTALFDSGVHWTGGDKVKVYSDTDASGRVYSLSVGAGSSVGWFSGPSVGGATHYVTYPETTSFDGSSFTFILPSQVDYNPDSSPAFVMPMIGSSPGADSFQMSHLCGVLCLHLTGALSNIKSFEFTFSSPVCGEAQLYKKGATLVASNSGSKTFTMNFTKPVRLGESPKDFFLSLPVGEYGAVSIKANLKDGGYSLTNLSRFDISRSKVTSVSTRIQSEILSERPRITTCSFNIYGQGMDSVSEDYQKWSYRKSGVFKVLKEQSFDVFCLQECEFRQRTEILSNVPSYLAYGEGATYGGESSVGKYNEDAANVVFYKSDMFNVLDKGTFWLTTQTPSSPAKYSKSRHYHSCSWMKLQYKSTGYRFYVFDTHLENGYNADGEATRAYEMPILYNKVNEINAENLPMMIYGDFNGSTTDLWSYCDACHYGWYWARNQDGKTDKGKYPASLNNWLSWPANKGSNVDHIAYKYFYEQSAGGKHGLVSGSFATLYEPVSGIEFISDHWPIKATFEFEWQ